MKKRSKIVDFPSKAVQFKKEEEVILLALKSKPLGFLSHVLTQGAHQLGRLTNSFLGLDLRKCTRRRVAASSSRGYLA